MAVPIQYASFLIRLWREASADATERISEWHGEVEHIQSGHCWNFCGLDELLSFLRQQAEDPDALRALQGK